MGIFETEHQDMYHICMWICANINFHTISYLLVISSKSQTEAYIMSKLKCIFLWLLPSWQFSSSMRKY